MGSLKSSEVGAFQISSSISNGNTTTNNITATITSVVVKGHDQKNNSCSIITNDQIPKMETSLIPPPRNQQPQLDDDEKGVIENINQSAAAAEHSLWEFFADQLEGDFMVSSPVRNLPPVQSHPSSSCFPNHNHPHQSCCLDNDDDGGTHCLISYDDAHHPIPMGCSPCPSPSAHSVIMSLSSPVRSPLPQPYNSATPNSNYYIGGFKGGNNNNIKGMSPIHRVLMNSPTNQYMEIESLSLPALEFLDDLDKDNDEVGGISSSHDCFDFSSVPELLECLIMPDASAAISRCSGSLLSSTQESSSNNDTTSVSYPMSPSSNGAPLIHQLQQERQHEKQQQQQRKQQQQHHHHQTQQLQQPQPMQNMTGSTLMVPLSFGPEQVTETNFAFSFHQYFHFASYATNPQEQDSGLRLVHLLLACAEAVAKEDYMLARRYLHHLNRVVTPLGDSMQRVASCFAEALGARLAATLTAASKPTNNSTTATTSSSSSSGPKPFTPFPPNSLEILKIYQILYQACPYIKFAHFTANQAIFEAFEAEERVHVIDLDILQGYQWPAFMQALAARPGGAPFLRITGVGPSPEGVRETGRCLTELAHSLHIPFEFHPVAEQLEDLKPHMFNRRVGEALAVNSVNRLHLVPVNSLGNLLGMIRDQAPNVVTIVEQEASHNGPYFLGRFLEALHYYSAIFDSLDATFPPDSLSTNAVTQSKILLGLYSCDGYRLTEDKGCLLLGWQDRAILAASAWRC